MFGLVFKKTNGNKSNLFDDLAKNLEDSVASATISDLDRIDEEVDEFQSQMKVYDAESRSIGQMSEEDDETILSRLIRNAEAAAKEPVAAAIAEIIDERNASTKRKNSSSNLQHSDAELKRAKSDLAVELKRSNGLEAKLSQMTKLAQRQHRELVAISERPANKANVSSSNVVGNVRQQTTKQTNNMALQQVVQITGTDEKTARAALNAAFGSVQRAIEYIFDPSTVPPQPPTSSRSSSRSGSSTSTSNDRIQCLSDVPFKEPNTLLQCKVSSRSGSSTSTSNDRIQCLSDVPFKEPNTLLQCKVRVAWSRDCKYDGTFTEYDKNQGMKCSYDDGDVKWYLIYEQEGSGKLYAYNCGNVNDVHWFYTIARPSLLKDNSPDNVLGRLGQDLFQDINKCNNKSCSSVHVPPVPSFAAESDSSNSSSSSSRRSNSTSSSPSFSSTGNRLGGKTSTTTSTNVQDSFMSVRRQAAAMAAERRSENSLGGNTEQRNQQYRANLCGRIEAKYMMRNRSPPFGLRAASLKALKRHWSVAKDL